jgi:hypothetical protein
LPNFCIAWLSLLLGQALRTAILGVAIALALAQRLVHQRALLTHQIAILLDRLIEFAVLLIAALAISGRAF